MCNPRYYQGGVRGTGFIHGTMTKSPGSVNWGLHHVTDWLPTLVAAAGGNAATMGQKNKPLVS